VTAGRPMPPGPRSPILSAPHGSLYRYIDGEQRHGECQQDRDCPSRRRAAHRAGPVALGELYWASLELRITGQVVASDRENLALTYAIATQPPVGSATIWMRIRVQSRIPYPVEVSTFQYLLGRAGVQSPLRPPRAPSTSPSIAIHCSQTSGISRTPVRTRFCLGITPPRAMT